MTCFSNATFAVRYIWGRRWANLRDPGKMNRFVERELTALLQAAGGTLPAFAKNESGSLVQVNPPLGHGHAAPGCESRTTRCYSGCGRNCRAKRARKLAESAQEGIGPRRFPEQLDAARGNT